MVDQERIENYCKDCDRSIWGQFPSCDVNIENEGRYTQGNHPCYCKIVNGKAVEVYKHNDYKRMRERSKHEF